MEPRNNTVSDDSNDRSHSEFTDRFVCVQFANETHLFRFYNEAFLISALLYRQVVNFNI